MEMPQRGGGRLEHADRLRSPRAACKSRANHRGDCLTAHSAGYCDIRYGVMPRAKSQRHPRCVCAVLNNGRVQATGGSCSARYRFFGPLGQIRSNAREQDVDHCEEGGKMRPPEVRHTQRHVRVPQTPRRAPRCTGQALAFGSASPPLPTPIAGDGTNVCRATVFAAGTEVGYSPREPSHGAHRPTFERRALLPALRAVLGTWVDTNH
jgi:hypothetical protein